VPARPFLATFSVFGHPSAQPFGGEPITHIAILTSRQGKIPSAAPPPVLPTCETCRQTAAPAAKGPSPSSMAQAASPHVVIGPDCLGQGRAARHRRIGGQSTTPAGKIALNSGNDPPVVSDGLKPFPAYAAEARPRQGSKSRVAIVVAGARRRRGPKTTPTRCMTDLPVTRGVTALWFGSAKLTERGAHANGQEILCRFQWSRSHYPDNDPARKHPCSRRWRPTRSRRPYCTSPLQGYAGIANFMAAASCRRRP